MVQSIVQFEEVEKSGLAGFENRSFWFMLDESMEIMFSSLRVKTGCSLYIFRSSQQEERNGRVHYAF